MGRNRIESIATPGRIRQQKLGLPILQVVSSSLNFDGGDGSGSKGNIDGANYGNDRANEYSGHVEVMTWAKGREI